jgi:hypothetical protein
LRRPQGEDCIADRKSVELLISAGKFYQYGTDCIARPTGEFFGEKITARIVSDAINLFK